MPRPPLGRVVKRALASILGLGVAFTAVMGFAHTKPGRPLLMLIKGSRVARGACPLGYDVAATPEQKAAARRRFAATHAGAERAMSRPALGFDLDRTTRADVQAWAASHSIACRAPRSGPDLDCADVPASALPEPYRGATIASVWMTFGARDTLTSVTVVRRDRSAEAISAAFRGLASLLAREAGRGMQSGDSSATTLGSGLLRQASAEYRFRDYYALARATNMGDGFALTEEYRSLPE
jgi:hypothetical protein